jgi:translation initiation factor 5B
MPQYVFNKKSPIILGVEVLEGVVKVGTPLVIPGVDFLDVGIVTTIENNRREVPSAKKGAQVSIQINTDSNPTLTYGRQFDHTHPLYSKISRPSIDALKEFFKRCVLFKKKLLTNNILLPIVKLLKRIGSLSSR